MKLPSRYYKWRLRRLREELHVAECLLRFDFGLYLWHPCRSVTSLKDRIEHFERKLIPRATPSQETPRLRLLSALRDWLEDNPHWGWWIPAAVFLIVGGVLWCCGMQFYGFLSAVTAAIATGFGLDEWENL